MSEKLVHKGKLTQDQEGSLVLVDEANKGYKVDNVVAAVWSKCENKTENEVTEELSAQVQETEKPGVKQAVKEIVGKLKEVNLVATA